MDCVHVMYISLQAAVPAGPASAAKVASVQPGYIQTLSHPVITDTETSFNRSTMYKMYWILSCDDAINTVLLNVMNIGSEMVFKHSGHSFMPEKSEALQPSH